MNDTKKAKPRGKPFQKGNKMSKGGKKLTEEEKRIRKLTKTNFRNVAFKFLDMEQRRLPEIIKDETSKVLDVCMASILYSGIKKGDEKKLGFFIERLDGKVKSSIDMKVEGELNVSQKIDVSNLSDEELETMRLMIDKCESVSEDDDEDEMGE